MRKKQLPDNLYPDTEDRFNRLFRAMAKPALQKQTEEDQTSDAERDEDCGDTQTPTDTSEDAF